MLLIDDFVVVVGTYMIYLSYVYLAESFDFEKNVGIWQFFQKNGKSSEELVLMIFIFEAIFIYFDIYNDI